MVVSHPILFLIIYPQLLSTLWTLFWWIKHNQFLWIDIIHLKNKGTRSPYGSYSANTLKLLTNTNIKQNYFFLFDFLIVSIRYFIAFQSLPLRTGNFSFASFISSFFPGRFSMKQSFSPTFIASFSSFVNSFLAKKKTSKSLVFFSI